MDPQAPGPLSSDARAARPRAAILGVGAWGPLGLDALQIAMCARAGKIEPRPTMLRDLRGHRISVVRSLALPDALQGWERLVALGAPALREAAAALGPRPAPLVLAAPEPSRPDDDDRMGHELLAALAERAEVAVDAARSAVVRAGHAGFALAVGRALELLESPSTPAVLVGGVDSYYHDALLQELDRSSRLNALDVQGGVIPSEAAAFLLLGRAGDPGGAAPIAWVRYVGSADGPGAAMASLVEAAARVAGPIAWVLTDVNGELWRLTEWAAAEEQSRGALAELARRDRWMEELGDVGAASGAVLAALACAFWASGCAPALSALIALHADGSERAALEIERAPGGRGFRASLGTPALHTLEGGEAAPRPAEGEQAQIRRLARDCMEDIAIFGDLWLQRGEAGSTAAEIEQRVLDNLDAVVALVRPRPIAAAVQELSRCAAEISFPDRGRGFALAFVLGCLDNEEAVRAAISAMRKAHPGTLPAWESGFRLASSGEVARALQRLLQSDRVPLVRVAIEVLRARSAGGAGIGVGSGAEDLEAVTPLLAHPEARVREAAARWLACAPPDAARPLLERQLDDPDEAVALASADGLLLLGSPAGLGWLRDHLPGEASSPGLTQRDVRPQAALLLALAGGRGDLARLVAAAGSDPRCAEALGWFGDRAAIEPLIGVLEEVERAIAAGEPVRGAEQGAARALHRITGAAVGADAAAWRAFWASGAAKLPAEGRLRFGELFTPAASLLEIERYETPLRVRRECAREVALHLGPAMQIDVDGWSAHQRAAVAAIRAAMARGEVPAFPAGWWLADLRAARGEAGS